MARLIKIEKELKKELMQTKDFLLELVGSIPVGIIATNLRGRVVAVNEQALELLGMRELINSTLDKPIQKLVSGIPVLEETLATQFAEERSSFEIDLLEIKTPSDSQIFLRAKGKPILGGFLLMLEDITKEKEIDKAKTEFVSLASHQLRTPLSTVNWYVEMLLAGDAGKLNEEQKKYLDEVYRSNQRMVGLVGALLNVSRLELGTFVVEPEPTDVLALARSVIDEQKPHIEEKKLKLTEKHADNLPLLNADPKLLSIVFQNILSNAVQYTPKGGKIEISLSLDDKKNILLKVSDTGYGIPKKQQDKIFTKLFRADNVQEKDTEGTGLGLYIVKLIIDHSGGKIWFESEENRGTTFYVTLPLGGMKKKEGTKGLS